MSNSWNTKSILYAFGNKFVARKNILAAAVLTWLIIICKQHPQHPNNAVHRKKLYFVWHVLPSLGYNPESQNNFNWVEKLIQACRGKKIHLKSHSCKSPPPLFFFSIQIVWGIITSGRMWRNNKHALWQIIHHQAYYVLFTHRFCLLCGKSGKQKEGGEDGFYF